VRCWSLECTILLLIGGGGLAECQDTSLPPVGNQLAVSVQERTAFDGASGLYTYSYAVQNGAGGAEAVELFAVQLGGPVVADVLNATSPQGWSFVIHNDRAIVSWAATDMSNSTGDSSGNLPASTYQVMPGASLQGFTFQSHVPPGGVSYYATGYAPLPMAAPGDIDDEHADFSAPDFTQIGMSGTTIGPVSTTLFGNGSKSIRAFVVVLAPGQGALVQSPVSIQIKFAIDGETIDRTTFHAELNSVDVTSAFSAVSGSVDLQGTFARGTSPLQVGTNDFIASVSGTDPQGGAAATGVSRVMFVVKAVLPGDLNGDGVVNCTDAAIAIAAFGTQLRQPGFDARADLNADGIVDNRDLTLMSTYLPSGTVCGGLATLVFSAASLTQVYDGKPKLVGVTTSPVGLQTSVTYSGYSSAPTNAGTYVVVAAITDAVYHGGATGVLSVQKATPVITWSTPASVTFGTALGSGQLDATASIPGSFVYSPLAGTVLPVGNGQTLSVVFIPTDTTDYNTASATTTINVLPGTSTGVQIVTTNVLKRDASNNIVVQLTFANTGKSAAANFTLTSVKIGSAAGTPVPQSLGSIGSNSLVQTTVTVPASAGASGTATSLAVTGTYTGGTLNSSARITLP